MGQYEYRPHYVRHLPHFQPPGATLFVTFRLAGSIPQAVLEALRREAEAREEAILRSAVGKERRRLLDREWRRQFGRWDDALDQAGSGPTWLGQPEIAGLVVASLPHRDGKVVDLDCYCVMPNHVHAVLAPRPRPEGDYHALQTILHALKRCTTREANLFLGREGSFWQQESYDHVVRDRRDWERIVAYVLSNPLKAGLVERWQDWPWSYLKP